MALLDYLCPLMRWTVLGEWRSAPAELLSWFCSLPLSYHRVNKYAFTYVGAGLPVKWVCTVVCPVLFMFLMR